MNPSYRTGVSHTLGRVPRICLSSPKMASKRRRAPVLVRGGGIGREFEVVERPPEAGGRCHRELEGDIHDREDESAAESLEHIQLQKQIDELEKTPRGIGRRRSSWALNTGARLATR